MLYGLPSNRPKDQTQILVQISFWNTHPPLRKVYGVNCGRIAVFVGNKISCICISHKNHIPIKTFLIPSYPWVRFKFKFKFKFHAPNHHMGRFVDSHILLLFITMSFATILLAYEYRMMISRKKFPSLLLAQGWSG